MDIAELIQKQGENFDAFKAANDQRLALIEKGMGTSEVDGKLAAINAELKTLANENREIQKRAGRKGVEAEMTAEQIERKEAFKTFMRSGEINQKALQTHSDPDGGYLVLPEMDAEIDRIAPTISAMYRLARVVNIGSAKYERLVKTSGLAGSWVADGATAGETTNPKYSKVEIEAFTAEIEPWVYNETLQDAMLDLEMDLAEEAGIGFAEMIGAALITGNGVGKPRGIAGYSNVANASYAWGSVGYIASGKSAAFASVAPGDKIIDLQHALPAQYRPGAVFLMNNATLAAARQIKDGSGSYYLWQPDPAAGFGGRFLGSPVEVDDNLAALGAGSISMAYGNFQRAYTIANRVGTSLIRDNITAKGKTKYNFRRRVGGGISNFEALKLMRFATS
jgi:HK97 family phage major capsid protein